jgi:hypothetical protein
MKQHAAPATAQDMADHAPAGGLRAVALVLAVKPERAVSPHRSGCGLWERRPWPMGPCEGDKQECHRNDDRDAGQRVELTIWR